MPTKTRSQRTQQRSSSGRFTSRRASGDTSSSIRRVQGGRADTGRDRGEDRRREPDSGSRRGDGRMGRRDSGWNDDERRGRGFAAESSDYRRERGPEGRSHWETAHRGSGASQGGAGRWENDDYRGRTDRGERWAEDDYRARQGPSERGAWRAEPWHSGEHQDDYGRPRREREEDFSDWRPSMQSREFPRGRQPGRAGAPYGEEQRDYRPQDWDYYGARERDYGRTGRERYASDFRRAEGYDEGVDRYGPGWQGQSEFRGGREDDRYRDERGYGRDDEAEREQGSRSRRAGPRHR
ncbi:MAG TPA: hypothetical protein VEB66_01320 [Opitutaceae bacterium]|nr:hypothetical protein [Opitutaceae bacterium]